MVGTLLERYGVLPRETLSTEGQVQFSDLYPILKSLEEAGKIRRGYFIKDLAATQFAEPGADDRLRLLRDPNRNATPITLAATDPANPYGAALPWPEGNSRPQRAAGARVVILDGALIGYVSRSENSLFTFITGTEFDAESKVDALTQALKGIVDGHARRALVIQEIDGQPSLESSYRMAFERAGFVKTSDGFFYRARL